jgi:thioesterase domain-containing protein
MTVDRENHRPAAARVARYAEAIRAIDSRGHLNHADRINIARAVVAVADEEQAELRAEVERLRGVNAAQTEVIRSYGDPLNVAEARLDALVADLRGLADEADSASHLGGDSYGAVVSTTALRAVLDKHAGEQAQGGEGS